MYKSFETTRLIIRPTREEDAAFFLKLMNTPGWIQFIGDRGIHTKEDARQYIIARMLPQLKTHGYSNNTVFRKEDNVPIGSCGLYDREGLDGVDIGFALLPEYSGKGYMYEASKELMRAANESFGLNYLQAITDRDNIRSQNLIKRLGFTFKGMVTLPEEDQPIFQYDYSFE